MLELGEKSLTPYGLNLQVFLHLCHTLPETRPPSGFKEQMISTPGLRRLSMRKKGI